jgi:excinuclease ABC subunit C
MNDHNTNQKPKTLLERGADTIRGFAKMLPDSPGVYRMLNDKQDVLYVGKARSLKKRVMSYTRPKMVSGRIQRMISQTTNMEFVHTHTEVEALLLEANLIKKLKPRYNVLLRDDKSFPFVLMTGDHDFPQIVRHRGAQIKPGEYFGPFASASSVYQTVLTLQKVFQIRNCSDHVFASRKRPCLQYHIKRCTAPCVGYVTKDQYADQVSEARDFLKGKSRDVQDRFAMQMQKASESMDFERAASLRDRIKSLTAIQSQQDINVPYIDNADVFGLAYREGKSCVQVFFFRDGQNFGNRSYFPVHDEGQKAEEILSSFLIQFYAGRNAPAEILIDRALPQMRLIQDALNSRDEQIKKTAISFPMRGSRTRLIEFVTRNADDALARYMIERKGDRILLEKLAALCGLEDAPSRIEVYDNSHISGTNMVGGMIVAGVEGFRKSAYRKFNIKDAKKSDDFGMMREVITRRFGRAIENEVDKNSDEWPDLILIDGGAGQLSAVTEILRELNIEQDVPVMAIAKGPDRNAGREEFYMNGRTPFQLPFDDPLLHYLQRLRDEAHRFAIGTHRARRTKQIGQSLLDDIPNIGAKRKKALLLHFGSAKAVQEAGLDDLAKVEGISGELAAQIYAYFHETQ